MNDFDEFYEAIGTAVRDDVCAHKGCNRQIIRNLDEPDRSLCRCEICFDLYRRTTNDRSPRVVQEYYEDFVLNDGRITKWLVRKFEDGTIHKEWKLPRR